MFFMVIFSYFRGLYYGSYMNPRGPLWVSGVAIFLMMGTGFGLCVTLGPNELWGATVITNLASAIPVVGEPLSVARVDSP